MNDPARLFIALYTDEDITSELAPALRERGFDAQSALEAGLLRVMNTLTANDMRNAVIYLQPFK